MYIHILKSKNRIYLGSSSSSGGGGGVVVVVVVVVITCTSLRSVL